MSATEIVVLVIVVGLAGLGATLPRAHLVRGRTSAPHERALPAGLRGGAGGERGDRSIWRGTRRWAAQRVRPVAAQLVFWQRLMLLGLVQRGEQARRAAPGYAPLRFLLEHAAAKAPSARLRSGIAGELARFRAEQAAHELAGEGVELSDACVFEIMERSGADLEAVFKALDRLACDAQRERR